MTDYISRTLPISYIRLNGGLNSTAGPLGVADNEASDLLNMDFDKFGSALKRYGYTALNTTAITGATKVNFLYWFEKQDGTRYAVCIHNSKLRKMDDLDGTWDDITGSLTLSATALVDAETFLDTIIATDNTNTPFYWSGTGDGATMTLPTGLTRCKFIKQFQNYCIVANCTVSASEYKSRFYFSTIKTIATWNVADFYDVAKDDGQEITGLKVLGDRLVIYKNRSIYIAMFTGDADIPFVIYKTNSSVGCASHWSIQEVENGHVFLSYDGLYYFDGNNSYKISDKITATLTALSKTYLTTSISAVYKSKNRYILGVTSGGGSSRDKVIVWDYFNKAFSVYSGMAPCSLATFYVNGVDERVYFGDYSGFVYRTDTGNSDYPLNTETAINAYFYTNWKYVEDLADQKGIPHIYIYYQTANTVLTFAYSYDFEEGDQYTSTFSLSGGTDVYGTGVYGTATYAGTGGGYKRRDLTGRGRTIRFKFANNTKGENFRIDGIGILAHLETNK